MAHTVLARRYRSNTFDEVVGQYHVAQALKRAISSGRLAHAFLFCGTRVAGKTPTARTVAKCRSATFSIIGLRVRTFGVATVWEWEDEAWICDLC